jgi:hypothetical protein
MVDVWVDNRAAEMKVRCLYSWLICQFLVRDKVEEIFYVY